MEKRFDWRERRYLSQDKTRLSFQVSAKVSGVSLRNKTISIFQTATWLAPLLDEIFQAKSMDIFKAKCFSPYIFTLREIFEYSLVRYKYT